MDLMLGLSLWSSYWWAVGVLATCCLGSKEVWGFVRCGTFLGVVGFGLGLRVRCTWMLAGVSASRGSGVGFVPGVRCGH